MRTSLPDSDALAEALSLPWLLPLSPSLSGLHFMSPVVSLLTIPNKHGEVGGLPEVWVSPRLALESWASPCPSLGLSFPICH